MEPEPPVGLCDPRRRNGADSARLSGRSRRRLGGPGVGAVPPGIALAHVNINLPRITPPFWDAQHVSLLTRSGSRPIFAALDAPWSVAMAVAGLYCFVAREALGARRRVTPAAARRQERES